MNPRWEEIDKSLARAEGPLLVALLAVMVGAGFLQVVLRNFFQTGIFGADLLLRQGLLWLGMLGASLGARGGGRHIEIDILTRALPDPWAGRARRLTDLFAAAICALLVRASWLFLAAEWEAGTRIAGRFPAWAFQIVLPAGFLLMGLRFLAAASPSRASPSSAPPSSPSSPRWGSGGSGRRRSARRRSSSSSTA